MKRKPDSKNNEVNHDSCLFQWYVYLVIACIMVGFLAAIVVIAFFIGDLFDLSDDLGFYLRFDWVIIICTFVSAVATITLGVVSIEQNKRLSEINERSLEVSKINNGYSLIHFRDSQLVEEFGGRLKIKLYDTKGVPLKSIVVKQVKLQPLKYIYVEDDKPSIVLSDTQQVIELKYTPVNSDNKEDFYYADIMVDFPFEEYKKGMYLRLELDIKVINVLGIMTVYEYYILNRVLKKEGDSIALNNYYEFNYCKSIKALSRD